MTFRLFCYDCGFEGACSHRKKAGNGNRTRMASLEGWNFTIKLCPRGHVNCRGPARLPSDFSRDQRRLIFLLLRSS